MLQGLKKWRSKSADKQDPEGCAAYVLITCAQPDAKGEMQVEMTYDGDKTLASYLLASAQGVIDDE